MADRIIKKSLIFPALIIGRPNFPIDCEQSLYTEHEGTLRGLIVKWIESPEVDVFLQIHSLWGITRLKWGYIFLLISPVKIKDFFL